MTSVQFPTLDICESENIGLINESLSSGESSANPEHTLPISSVSSPVAHTAASPKTNNPPIQVQVIGISEINNTVSCASANHAVHDDQLSSLLSYTLLPNNEISSTNSSCAPSSVIVSSHDVKVFPEQLPSSYSQAAVIWLATLYLLMVLCLSIKLHSLIALPLPLVVLIWFRNNYPQAMVSFEKMAAMPFVMARFYVPVPRAPHN